MDRKLHIGGVEAHPGWEIINITKAPYVDHIGNARDLTQFEDNTFIEIYASHVIEHFDYKNELSKVLMEWKRVLKPGGKIFISTPDLDVLATLFILKDKLSFEERFHVMRIMFGGHVDQYDYHYAGFNQEILGAFLKEAGFINMQKVDSLKHFQDTSKMLFKGVPISINIIAEKSKLN